MLEDYGVQVITRPAFEPVTVGELKSHSRVLTNLDDGLIAGYAMAAREYAENFTGNACVEQTLDITLDAFPPLGEIDLPVSPVRSITSITYQSDAGPTLVPGTDYVFSPSRLRPKISLAAGKTWPTPLKQASAITIRCVAGYMPAEPLPETIRQAICLLTAYFYENRESAAVGTVNDLPLGIEHLLTTKHRNHWL